MAKSTPSTLLDRLSGQKTWLMIDLFKLVVNRGSATLMASPCHWFVRGDFMYLSHLGKPSDEDLESYTAANLTRPHEKIPSVFHFTHPSGDGEPPKSNDSNERFAFDPNVDEFGDYCHRAIKTRNVLDDSSHPSTLLSTIRGNQHVIRSNQHVVNNDTHDYETLRIYFSQVNVDTVQKTMEKYTQCGVPIPNTFAMRKHLKSMIQHLTPLEDKSQLLLILIFF